jgi:lambda family phage tail tape measure protein
MPDMINVGANVDPALQGLKKLETQLGLTGAAFNKMKEAVVGFATIGFLHSLLEMADGLSDAAKAAGVSTEALMGFSAALSANGGNAEGALKGIAAFSQQIAQAAEGSKSAQDAFLKVNIGLKELGALSEEDLLKQTILGIAAIDDPSRRAAAGMANFGKAAKGVDWVGVAGDIDKFIAKNKEAAAAVETAGDVADSLSATYKDFKVQVLVALQPIAELAKVLLAQKEVIGVLIKTLIDLGTAFLVFKYVLGPLDALRGRIGTIVAEGTSMGAVFGGLGSKVKDFGQGISNSGSLLKSAFTGSIDGVKMGYTGLERMGVAVAGLAGIFGRLFGAIAILWAIYDVVNAITKAVTGSGIVEWGEKLLKAMGIISQTSAEREKATKAAENQAKANREVIDAMAQEKLNLDKILDGYIRQNDEANKKFKLETETLGLSTEQKLIKEQIAEADKNYVDTIIKLTDEYNAKKATGSESDLRMLPLIQKKIQEVAAARGAETDKIKDNVAQRVNALKIDDLEKFSLKERIELQDKLKSIQDDMAKSTMTELERKNYDILAAARLQGKQAADNFEIANKTKLSESERQQYIDTALKGTDQLIAKNTELYNQSRSFNTGWTNAFNDYVTNATNAAEQAKNIFNKFTQGLEDTFVNFVKTGKFEWKNFVASMAEEILRGQLKSAIASVMEKFNVGKLFGGAGSAIGGKTRGDTIGNPMFVQDVSKKAGEMFQSAKSGQGASPAGTTEETKGFFDNLKTTIEDFATGVQDFLGNMFSGLGSFIGNFASSVGSVLSSIGGSLWDIISTIGSTLFDVISSLGSGLGDILGSIGGSGGGGSFLSTAFDAITNFLGFAGGGVIPSNSPVIVGEKGPELLFGSQGAAVIPNTALGGQPNHVIYNINAVDAMSFKQMLAQDPSFLYAVTQQGAKSMPVRR